MEQKTKVTLSKKTELNTSTFTIETWFYVHVNDLAVYTSQEQEKASKAYGVIALYVEDNGEYPTKETLDSMEFQLPTKA